MTIHLISPLELSRQLKVSKRTLGRWHACRRGPPRIKVGKLVGYRPTAVEAWLEQNEAQSLGQVAQ